jgi:murein DD-endopeptidase MepM/ murein hydrolase activator NlpD
MLSSGKKGEARPRPNDTEMPVSRTRARLSTTCLILVAALAGGPAHAAPASPLQVRISRTTLQQGQTARVVVQAPGSLAAVKITFAGRTWPVYRGGPAAWLTFLATDPMTRPGRYTLVVEAASTNGPATRVRREMLVQRVAFPQRRLTFDPETLALLTPENVERERRRVREALAVLHPAQLWTDPLAIPLEGPVSSPYGVLSVYQGVTRGFHTGVDFAAPEGAPVRAAATGIVRLAELLPLSGKSVMVDHGLGVVTSYLHMSAIDVAAGQRVQKGDVVGRVGSTGLATGPHLHWGLRVNGVRVDPLGWTR